MNLKSDNVVEKINNIIYKDTFTDIFIADDDMCEYMDRLNN